MWNSRRQAAYETCAVVLGFTVLTLLGTYPLVRDAASAIPSDLGDPVLNAWILGWDADRIRHGFQGLWNAPNYFPYPQTLTYSEHLLGIALLTAPVQWISGNPVLAYNFAVVVSYVLAGTGMYLLALSLTGSRLAAVVSGVAFAFVPYRVAQLPHLQVLMAGWMPLSLFALHRYFDSGSRLALLGFAAAYSLQALSNIYFMYFLVVPVAIVVTAELIRGRRPRRRTFAELAVAGILILAVLAPVAVAYLQTHGEQGFGRSRANMVRSSADVISYFQIHPRLSIWGDVLERGRAEGELFPGFLLIGLATAGLAAGLAPAQKGVLRLTPTCRGAARLYGTIGVVAFVLSLGPEPAAFGRVLTTSGPYDWLLSVVPGLEGMRVPARLAVVVHLALSVLAAVGVTVLVRSVAQRIAPAVCVLVATTIFAEGYAPVPMRPFDPSPSAAHEWIRTQPPGAVLEVPLTLRGRPHTAFNVRYQFATLHHGHPVVNGYSGYTTPLFRFLADTSSPLLELNHYAEVVRGLRSLGVRYVVVNTPLYENRSDAEATINALQRQRRQLQATMEFQGTTVFQLEEWNEEPEPSAKGLRELPLSAFHVIPSHGQTRWTRAVDDDPRTRWLSGSRQKGDEVLEVRFDRPRDIAMLRLGMAGRSLRDYPRRLVIEAVDEQGDVARLYRGGVLPQLLHGVLRNNNNWVDVDIQLRGTNIRTLRVRQMAATRTWHWSINEFSLWSRTPTPDLRPTVPD